MTPPAAISRLLLALSIAQAAVVANSVTAQTSTSPNVRGRTASPSPGAIRVNLPWRKVVLSNGFTLLMAQDTTVPSAAIQLWMRGGAREEKPGQEGVAHLFEHELPTSGRFLSNTANRAAYSAAVQGGGAGSDLDFLRFYLDTNPSGVAAVIGYFADRFESDTTKFTPERLERDKNIVMSELNRNMNVDWNTEVMAHLARGTFGSDHAYDHSTSGSEATVRAATVELMRDWHRRFALPVNSGLIVVGNFDPTFVEATVRRNFESIPPGKPLPRLTEWVEVTRPRSEEITVDAPTGAHYLRWAIPAWGSADADYLTLFADILESRLEKRAETDSLIGTPTTHVELYEAAGYFEAQTHLTPGDNSDRAEAVLRSEIARLLDAGPTPAEVEIATTAFQFDFARSLEQLGDRRNGRVDAIGLGWLFKNDPDAYRERLNRIAAATPVEVRNAARRWITGRGYSLRVNPPLKLTNTGPFDRTSTVTVPPAKPIEFPVIEPAVAANGLRTIAVHRGMLPLARITLAFNSGISTDDARTAGRARIALEALLRTRVGPDRLRLSEALVQSGAQAQTAIDQDAARLTVSALADRGGQIARLVRSALETGPSTEAINEAIADARQQAKAITSDASRARLRAGACPPGASATCNVAAIDGFATRASLASMNAASIREFVLEFYKPSNATLVVSGTFQDADVLTPFTGQAGLWVRSTPPQRRQSAVSVPAGKFILIDQPGAAQASLLLLQPVTAKAAQDPALSHVVAFAFRQNLMANLRESKGWSYEVYPYGIEVMRGGAFLQFNVPLTTDKVAEAITEIKAEAKKLRETPVDAQFLSGIKGSVVGDITGGLGALERLNGMLVDLGRLDLPSAYYRSSITGIASITPEMLRTAAAEMIDPDKMTWVIAGDLRKLQAELAELGVAQPSVVRLEDLQ